MVEQKQNIQRRRSTAGFEKTSIDALKTSLQGELLQPGDEAYESARMVWNGLMDRRPALIVRCAGVADVIHAVNFAREQGMAVSVRSGGHSMAGFGTNEGGMVIDLSLMKGIAIDPLRCIARIEPGLTWSEVANTLHPYDLAITSGDVGTAGVGGLLPGGGIGWMVRKYGLTIDRLRSVELVTADGQLLRASADENSELFWGLRGGGGNFGVATAFEVDLHPGGTILGGVVVYEATEAERILRDYVRIASEAPDELSTQALLVLAPPEPFIPPEKHGTAVVAILVCYSGDLADGERVVAPLRQLATPIVDLVAPMPYPAIFAFTAIGEVRGMQHHVRSQFFETLSDEMIHALAEASQAVMGPESYVQLRVLGGAISQVDRDATAFAHRDKQGLVMVTHFAPPSAADPVDLQARSEHIWRALSPYANGVYVNFLMDFGELGVHSAYPPATYARLAALKQRYDPTNLFRLNQNIIPA